MQELTEISKSISSAAITKHGIIALFGGVANAINKHRTGESKGLLDFVALSLLSSFFGLLFGLIALSLGKNNEYLTLCAAGMGGWLGIEGAGIISSYIKKIFNVK